MRKPQVPIDGPSTRPLRSALAPVDRGNLGDEVVARLRAAIHAGELSPGERIVEQSIAQSMNVSRGPVREAHQQLEREGLVTSERNRGTFVARLTRADIEEIYSLRLVLERLAVKWAVRNATSAGLAELQAIVDQMASSARKGLSERDAAELDMQFHDALYRVSGHKRLMEFWKTLRPQILVFLLSRNLSRSDYGDIIVQFHQRIIDAIADRKERPAAALIEEHIGNAYAALVEFDNSSANQAGFQRYRAR
jgi:DNA-binding GntR family transcriptional regulator